MMGCTATNRETWEDKKGVVSFTLVDQLLNADSTIISRMVVLAIKHVRILI
jgi:hypothetical protein